MTACGIVRRLPQEPHPPRRAHGFRRKYHRYPLTGAVVSKCALREAEAYRPSLSFLRNAASNRVKSMALA